MSEIVQLASRENYTLIQMDDGKANAFGFDMLEQLNQALDQAEEAGKVVLIAGRPGKFSAGFDLKVMAGLDEQTFKLLQAGASLAQRLLEFPTPVVLAVSGHALAMGALVLLSADYRIGCEGNFKLGLNEVAIGMTMPYFGVELARARLTPSHFQLAVNCAQLYDAKTAVPAGFLDEAVPAEQLMDRAQAVAEQLALVNMQAHKATKDRVRAPLNQALVEALAKEFPA
jgi:enoyl-CoA hydratase